MNATRQSVEIVIKGKTGGLIVSGPLPAGQLLSLDTTPNLVGVISFKESAAKTCTVRGETLMFELRREESPPRYQFAGC